MLLRPQTGLQDVFFEMDPGTEGAGEIEEGGTGHAREHRSAGQPRRAADRARRRHAGLPAASARRRRRRAWTGRGKDLGKVLGSLGPITSDLDAINRKVAERANNLRSLITNFNQLSKEVGSSEQALTDLVTSSNAAVGAIAEQDPSVQRAVQLLPSTLKQSTITLNNVAAFADQLGPAVNDLRPFARNLDELNASVEKAALTTTPVIKNQIRPFVRAARKPIPDLRTAAKRFSKATPRLTVVGKKINRLGNMAAYNPNGAEGPGVAGRDEGYLFWAAWLGHNSNSVFQVQDAHGVERRIYLTLGCDEALSLLGASPLAPAVTGLNPLFAPGGPFAGGC